MHFLNLLFRVAKLSLLGGVGLLSTLALLFSMFGAPPSFMQRLQTIGTSPNGEVAWGIAGDLILFVWWSLTEHPVLVVIIWLGVAYMWWLMTTKPKAEMEDDFKDARLASRERFSREEEE